MSKEQNRPPMGEGRPPVNDRAQMQKGNPFRGGPGPMGGPPGAGMSTEKAKNFKGTLKKLINYLGGYKFAIIVVVIFAMISTVFSIVGPKILGQATTEIYTGLMGTIDGSTSGIDFAVIGSILTWLIILYVISAVFQFLQSFIMTGVSNKTTFKMRKELDEKIHSLPLSYYDKTTNGEVLSRISNDVDTINQSLNQSITQLITCVTTIVGIIIMMLTISWQMTLVALVTLPVSFAVIGQVFKKSQKHFVSQQRHLGSVNGIVEESYSCHVIVKSFNGEENILNEFNDNNDKLYASAWRANFISGLMMPFMKFIGNIGYVAICIIGGFLAIGGGISIGDIQAFIQYMNSFNQPIQQVSQVSNIIQQTIAASERVFEFLEETDEIADKEGAYKVTEDPAKADESTVLVNGDVDFNNVSFGYNKDKIIINDFTANVKSGKKIAIVGPTGAGKTTMVKLLMRFYDVTSGSIMLDGIDIRDYEREQLRSAFGMVLQETWLYNASIAENIRYGRLDATDEEVKAATKAAQAHNFIKTLPGGYNMVLNEEASNVSQGQKQLLTIARAILADPKVLILDEATSSVDTRTEILIQKAMDNLMEGRTSFIIAHRLSTIRNADLILVMKDGDIVEQGNHDELMEQGGFYANLYNSQFEKTIA